MSQYRFISSRGLYLGICALFAACVAGEIGEGGGERSFGADPNEPPGAPSDPGTGGEDSPLVCPDASADVSASSGWQSSQASQPASGELRFEFKARPTAEDLNGLIAVGAQDIDAFTEAAIAVRFAEDGFVDARDGGIYDSDVSYPYGPGVWYSVVVTADIASKTYDVEIGSCSESPKMLIQDASFRDDASISDQLSGWAVWSSQSAALEVSTPAWISSSEGCLPATCQTLGHVCGQPSDGCGGVLSCGACGNGLICASGVCIDESTPPPPCQPASCQTLVAECGAQGDGCGGILSCGGCSSGQICSRGACVAEPAPPPPCEPATCQTLSAECGVQSDRCGGTVNCGSCTGGDVCVAGTCYDPETALEPENTQGDSWETMYERCTGDDYPSGYRPPLFVRPTMQNSGANCPDTSSGCPSATLTERTADITAPGTYENFYVTGTLKILADNVIVRNFEITCTGGEGNGQWGLDVTNGRDNVYAEYGTIEKCGFGIVTEGGSSNLRFAHMHVDQYASDGTQSNALDGPIMIERSLYTRGGWNGGYGSSAHADSWQYWGVKSNMFACWLGSRVVPSYCPNFYKISNATQNFGSDGGRMYLYNNWLDGGTNVLLGGTDMDLRNNKWGHVFDAALWYSGRVNDYGGNVWECNGQPVLGTDPDNSPQLTCPWGYDNDPVTGWDGQSQTDFAILDGTGNPITCTGTADDQPIDPTEFCTSDDSGCVVTR